MCKWPLWTIDHKEDQLISLIEQLLNWCNKEDSWQTTELMDLMSLLMWQIKIIQRASQLMPNTTCRSSIHNLESLCKDNSKSKLIKLLNISSLSILMILKWSNPATIIAMKWIWLNSHKISQVLPCKYSHWVSIRSWWELRTLKTNSMTHKLKLNCSIWKLTHSNSGFKLKKIKIHRWYPQKLEKWTWMVSHKPYLRLMTRMVSEEYQWLQLV